jgi:hypothetical protein
MRWALVALCACARATQPDPLSNWAHSTKLVAIENVKPLPFDLDTSLKRDCRPSSVIRRRFRGETVIACGPVEIDAKPEELRVARECVEKALADQQPFLLEVENEGIDSHVASGVLGVVEKGELAVYQMTYDSDPCGGSCPDRGLTTIERCSRIVRDVTNPEACAVNVNRCFHCEAAKVIELCRPGS